MTRKNIVTLLLATVLSVMTAAIAGAQSSNRAALVVRFSDDRVETHCVAFQEEQVSGYDLLLRSGLPLEVGDTSFGASVCRVDDVGCSAANCFCECRGGSCTYWSYWHLQDGEWRYSSLGATAYQVQDGDVEGWSWGPGSVSEATPPPVVTFDEVCAAEEAATPSPAATVTGPEVTGEPAQATATGASSAATPGAGDAEATAGAAPGTAQDVATGEVPWSYALFAGIVLLLAGAIVWVQGRGGS